MKQTLYKKIYKTVVDKIMNKEYVEGDKLPTENELAQEYDVSRITSKKALDQLALDGYIKRIQGKGSYVLSIDEAKINKGIDKNQPFNQSDDDHLLIGIVMSDFNSSYGVDILSGMELEVEKNNSFMIVKRSFDDQTLEKNVIDKLINIGVDGLVIIPVHGEFYNPTILKLILDEFPVVVVDRQLKGLPASFVGTNNILAAEKAVNYLFQKGHRNIAHVSAPIQNTPLKDRVEGIKKSYSENGVVWNDSNLWLTNITNYVPGQEFYENKEEELQLLMKKIEDNPEVTCIFALEYGIANFIKKAIKKLGKRVPEDIAIICFDEPKTYTGESFFTHIKQDEDNMGRWAIKLLIEQLTEGKAQEKIMMLDTQLIIGETTQ
ncbi:GntR family transcriptional regulator [Vallitalea okinawensis]|uniref:GntR family transcriptional regulator n=1 Tax=Vallitalea okinawensis TaxID=2078660 RepID=UPI000CFBF2EC|nr:GntR family transcriptional regulator [Vallitalea okinawensis]